MDRAIPSVNKILQKKQREKDDEKLVNQLRVIKKSQSSYNFRVKDKVKIYKRIAFNDVQKTMEIRRENLILAKKIKDMGEEHFNLKKSRIKSTQNMRSTKLSNLHNLSPIISNECLYQPPHKKTLTNINNIKVNSNTRSLNDERRKKELLRITMENLHIRDRIVSMKSTYNGQDWKEHAKKNYEYLSLHCEYPVAQETDIKNLYDAEERNSMFRTQNGKFFNSTLNKSVTKDFGKTESKFNLPAYHMPQGKKTRSKSKNKSKLYNTTETDELLPVLNTHTNQVVHNNATIKTTKKRDNSKDNEQNSSKEKLASPKRALTKSKDKQKSEKNKSVEKNKNVEKKPTEKTVEKFDLIYEQAILHRSRGFECLIKKFESSGIEISIKDKNLDDFFIQKLTYELYKTAIESLNQDVNKFLVIKINQLVFGEEQTEPWMMQSMSQIKQDEDNPKENNTFIQESQSNEFKDDFCKEDEVVEQINPIKDEEPDKNLEKPESAKKDEEENKVDEVDLQQTIENKDDEKFEESPKKIEEQIEEQVPEQIVDQIKSQLEEFEGTYNEETFEQDFTKSNNLMEEK